MKTGGNPRSPGHYAPLREAHERALKEASERSAPAERLAASTHAQPKTEYERWRAQTIARIEKEREHERQPPPRSQDAAFERALDEKQRAADEAFKMQFGEDAERPDRWRNQERRIMMKSLPTADEAKDLGDLRRREQRLYEEKGHNKGADNGAEP